MPDSASKKVKSENIAKSTGEFVESGIVIGAENAKRNPHVAAIRAFQFCFGYSGLKEWNELRDSLDAPSVQYYRKISEYCLRASRRYNVPEEWHDEFTYAWEYYNAEADRMIAESNSKR